MVNPMASKPRGLGAQAQELRNYKSNTCALTNLIGVDSAGCITTAVIGDAACM